ncbi:MAG: ArsR/SmtB family transcription factor [Fidelibacterota bacterium]
MNPILSIFKALSDQNRLRIFTALMNYEELCGCQIIELLQVTGATVSRHMDLLLSAGLVKSRKEGRWVFYHLNNEEIYPSFLEWINQNVTGVEIYQNDRERLREITVYEPDELCRIQRGEKCCPNIK